MPKVVINKCFGGFGVSEAVYEELGLPWDGYGYLTEWEQEANSIEQFRSDPRLVAAVEKVGLADASGSMARLKIVDVPDDAEWYIDEYDGAERVNEAHRSWS